MELFGAALELFLQLNVIRSRDLDGMNDRLEMLEESRNEWRSFAQRLVPENTQLLNQISALQEDLRQKDQQIANLNAQEFDRMEQQTTQLLNQITVLQEDLRQKDQQIATLNAQLLENFENVQTNLVEVIGRNQAETVNMLTHISSQVNHLESDFVRKLSLKNIFIGLWPRPKNILAPARLEYMCIRDKPKLDDLTSNIMFYKKELFIWIAWKFTNSTNGHAGPYANLVTCCRDFKRLRPDGEIRLLRWYYANEAPTEVGEELTEMHPIISKYLWVNEDLNITAVCQFFGEPLLIRNNANDHLP